MAIMEMMVTHSVLLGMESLMGLPLQQEMSLAVVSISSTTLVFTPKMELTLVTFALHVVICFCHLISFESYKVL